MVLGEKYKANLPKSEIKRIRYEIAAKYLQTIIDYKKDAEKVLKYLKEKNYILVLATTTNDHTIETYKKYNQNIISKAPLDSIFDLIYSKGAVKNLKPNPEIHYKILETLNVKPEECLIVEDVVFTVVLVVLNEPILNTELFNLSISTHSSFARLTEYPKPYEGFNIIILSSAFTSS